MSGKPAARQGDMTRKGLDIVQGSAGVLIGAPTGLPARCVLKKGQSKLWQPGEPGAGCKGAAGRDGHCAARPAAVYSFPRLQQLPDQNTRAGGVFGPGWKAPFDIRLQIRDEGLILNDSGGRSIHFEPLFPGEISYSRSESLWLARGGVAAQHSSQPLSALWQVLPEDVRLSPHVYRRQTAFRGRGGYSAGRSGCRGRTRCCRLRRPHTGC